MRYHKFVGRWPSMMQCVECNKYSNEPIHTLPTDQNQEANHLVDYVAATINAACGSDEEAVKTPDRSVPRTEREAHPSVEALSTICMMADCTNPHSHFCITHDLEIYGTLGSADVSPAPPVTHERRVGERRKTNIGNRLDDGSPMFNRRSSTNRRVSPPVATVDDYKRGIVRAWNIAGQRSMLDYAADSTHTASDMQHRIMEAIYREAEGTETK